MSKPWRVQEHVRSPCVAEVLLPTTGESTDGLVIVRTLKVGSPVEQGVANLVRYAETLSPGGICFVDLDNVAAMGKGQEAPRAGHCHSLDPLDVT